MLISRHSQLIFSVVLVLIYFASINCHDEEHRLGSTITLRCYGKGKLSWKFNPEELVNNTRIRYRNGTLFPGKSLLLTLTIENATYSDTGNYACVKNGNVINSTDIYVHENKTCGKMIVPLQMKTLKVYTGHDFVIPCRPTRPGVNLKLERKLITDTRIVYKLIPGKGFSILNATNHHSGTWVCKSECQNIEADEQITIEIIKKIQEPLGSEGDIKMIISDQHESESEMRTILVATLSLIGSLAAAFAIVIFVGFNLIKKERRARRLKAQNISLLFIGVAENIDVNVALDQQADLLPYNPNYEFPRERLKLGRPLGCGAFGRVVRAEASAPLYCAIDDSRKQKTKDTTTVAVKMVKQGSELSQVKALISELKILMHIGKHLNVVNLLGACTTNLSNEELLVIVEYCRYGNLRSHLLKQRENFVDQVDHLKDTLDFTIGVKDYHQLEYNAKEITTRDLVCWSYQVARGMQYLASRRIVHADLAARNILLADHNVVKICDFGLARNLYSYANYLKKSDEPLPIKWMAIESIRDRIFSTETDVWSFGVVMWEFFTLAMTPYPGIPKDEFFMQRLIKGHRLEKPQYATSEIYNIMQKCWDKNSSRRPNFSDLENDIDKILEDNVKQFYLDLNNPYMKLNSIQKEYENLMRTVLTQESQATASNLTESGDGHKSLYFSQDEVKKMLHLEKARDGVLFES
ncbi:Hypothetical predicted protein [Cloeon dipterum]|uniref:receptor protein-tyrosine kinase n=1 Tax=Cloeon dipterum TaxID=197152 RepID=A0A8S1C469_9INSE|nr:Hypothetical predicted protein [Cloeon dipterum]